MTDEEKREKIMKALACHADTSKACDKECPYLKVSTDDVLCSEALARDALALLREQEPRVMTKEEINKCAESLDPDPIFVQWRETGGAAWVARAINIIAGMVNAGNRSVRAWTSRPSPEHMRETPWEESAI